MVVYLPPRAHVQLFAFGTEAAAQLDDAIKELAARYPDRSFRDVRAGTFHSVGMAAVLRHLNLPKSQIVVDPGKCLKLLREWLCVTPEGEETFGLYSAFVRDLVEKAKGEGIGPLVADTEDRWWTIVDHYGLYLDSEEANPATGIEIARELLARSNAAARQGLIDFADMLYLVCLWKLRLWRNDVVIVDEAQDTNPVRRAMTHLALKDGGRLFAVGDDRQSIMGFTGASTDALDVIAREFNTRELPLTVSYRCSRAVVEMAQTWVPDIESAPGAAEGEVLNNVSLQNTLARLTATDAILCRQTAPLVTVAYGLIARGRPCRILGREIGEGLVNLIERQKARGIDRLVEKLNHFREREVAKFIARAQERQAEAVGDRVDCALVLIGGLAETERTIPALIEKIRSMFQDDKKGEKQTVLTLCTCHKAKGKEWQQVAILRPELMPSKAARQDWQICQEENLQYVAATRAKETLIYIRDEDMELGK
jgi:superfamily I DNA/RNA helicase